MLTPEQIQEFQARADAGEKPTEGWWHIVKGRYQGFWGCSVIHLPRGLMIGTGDGFEYNGEGGWYVSALPATLNKLAGPFDSMPAAQLAAEHMIKEATAMLHRPLDANGKPFWVGDRVRVAPEYSPELNRVATIQRVEFGNRGWRVTGTFANSPLDFDGYAPACFERIDTDKEAGQPPTKKEAGHENDPHNPRMG